MSSPPVPAAGDDHDHIQADEDAQSVFDDEANDVRDDSSSLASLTSSILKGTVEGGRTYAAYGQEEYGLPMDDAELERIDMCHAKYYALLNKRRFLAPIGDTPQRILDLGCGTGIWCIDMADKFPSANVIGTDIAPTQPGWVPPNCSFELDDFERPWTWKTDSFDFIFARDLILAVRDYPKLIDQCFTHLKPGGWVEFQSVTGILRCDDGSLPDDSNFRKFSDTMYNGSAAFGAPIDDPLRWKGWMEARGFVNVTEKVLKLPTSPWPKDQRLKLLGALEMDNLLGGLEGMLMRMYQKGLGWTAEETHVFLALLRKDIRNLKFHTYWPYYVVYGQRPPA